MSAKKRDEAEHADRSERRKPGAPASFSGDIGGGGASGGTSAPVGSANRPEPPRDLPRTATDMAPGIPEGSGRNIDKALDQPDTELGGGVAGDTTPCSETTEKPDRDTVRQEDRDRTTL